MCHASVEIIFLFSDGKDTYGGEHIFICFCFSCCCFLKPISQSQFLYWYAIEIVEVYKRRSIYTYNDTAHHCCTKHKRYRRLRLVRPQYIGKGFRYFQQIDNVVWRRQINTILFLSEFWVIRKSLENVFQTHLLKCSRSIELCKLIIYWRAIRIWTSFWTKYNFCSFRYNHLKIV